MRYLKIFSLFLIVIGIVAISLNTIFGYNTIAYLERVRIEETGQWIYKYNFINYISNLQMSIGDTAQLELILPWRTWTANIDITNWGNAIGNNMALILDYIIMILNVLLYPFRVGAYITQQMLAILGVKILNNETNIKWLTNLVETLKGLQIPYV